jgi:parallel beta-helix repeat protein
LIVAADNLTIDGGGATLLGEGRQGTGILIRGRKNVVVRNCVMREYRHAIAVFDAQQVRIEKNQITSTAEVEDNTIFLNIWEPAENSYGAAVVLSKVTDGLVFDNDLRHNMNGLLTYGCTKLVVRDNNANFSSGFGIHLNGTCDSTFEGNYADFCCRWEPRDKTAERPHGQTGKGCYGHMGADATGFLIINGACRNVFRRNSARMGGDGFFLAGWGPKGPNGSDNNLFEENDGSLSPNIAFEATFSRGNIFRNNWADRCNYGFWLGFSRENVLEGNRMLFNRQAGIAVEHGIHFTVRDNDFQSNGNGVLLWSRWSKDLDKYPEHKTSHHWVIEKNKFFRNGSGIAIVTDCDHGVRPMPAETCGKPEVRPHDHVIRGNDIQDNRIGIRLKGADKTIIEGNKLNANAETNVRCEEDRETEFRRNNLGAFGAYL